jgi:hypothetical protein
MSNKHNFTSSVSQVINLESKINYIKNFTSTIISSQIFTSILNGLTPSLTWIVKFISNQNISVNKVNTRIKIYAHFVSGNLNIAISDVLILLDFRLRPFFVQNSTIQAIMTMSQKMANVIIYNSSSIYTRIRERLNIKSTQFDTLESMSASITARKYYLLSDWDSYLLSDLDSMTLQDMDYQVV